MSSSTPNFAKYLRQLLADRSLKPQNVAGMLNVDRSLVRKWMTGARVPALKSAYFDLLCVALDLTEPEQVMLKKAQIYSLDEDFVRLADLEKAESRAAELEQAMLSLLNAITEAAVLIDPEGRIIAANSVVAERSGQQTSEIIGRRWYDLLDAERVENWRKVIAQVLAEGKPSRLKERHGERWTMLSLYPSKDGNGKVVGVAIVGADVTEMEKALEALQRSEERLRHLFAHSLEPMFLTKPDGTTLAANPAACNLLGMSEAEIIAAGRKGILDGENENLAAAVKEWQESGKAGTAMTLVKGNGTKVKANVIASQFRNRNDELESFVIVRPWAMPPAGV